jgi:uncharacterized membrane protein YfcA
MSQPTLILIISIGFLIGTLSGMVGMGGGTLVIPVLMFGFGFSQVKANGTSLAMLLPPIGILGVMSYWHAGNVDLKFAGLLAIGFAAGVYCGAKIVNSGWISPSTLRLVFALLLIYVTSRLLFQPGGKARAAIETALLFALFTVPYAAAMAIGRHWDRRLPNAPASYQSKRRLIAEHDYQI